MVFLWVYICVFALGLWLSFELMIFLLIHGFRLGIKLCLSFRIMLFLRSLLWVYVTPMFVQVWV